MEKLIPYSIGITAMSVCVDKKLTKKEIEKLANTSNPTGIASQWKISEDKFFLGNVHTNPCKCDQFPKERMHYLLNC